MEKNRERKWKVAEENEMYKKINVNGRKRTNKET